ncbi:excalibur calcium-binding domain-containing protein [Williamsia sp. M5A3_1d]
MNRTAPHHLILVSGMALAVGIGTVVTAAPASAAARFSNCAQLNQSYSHGVGLPGARDKVSGSKRPVTNFTTDRATYQLNKRLDRDNDGIACEKK